MNDKLKLITIIQKWSSGKIPIGTVYSLNDSNKKIKLICCDGYPNGKFVFDNGEEFDIGRHFKDYFIELKHVISEEETLFDEEVWNEFDRSLNDQSFSNSEMILRNQSQKERKVNFEDKMYFYVSDIINSLLEEDSDFFNRERNTSLSEFISDVDFPFSAKERLNVIFQYCNYEEVLDDTKNDVKVYKVISKNEFIGYLVGEKLFLSYVWKYFPNVQKFSYEYYFQENQAVGFYYAAENYLDIALETIERYGLRFSGLVSDNTARNEVSYGYQADSSIKTLLAFSCECYLKSLLLFNEKKLKDLKDIGHGLTELFTSLDDETISKVFMIMIDNYGYNLVNTEYYDVSDITEKFMIDLAKYSSAFTDARYSAENNKDINYNFLKIFALSLRDVANKIYSSTSPFYDCIEENTSLAF